MSGLTALWEILEIDFPIEKHILTFSKFWFIWSRFWIPEALYYSSSGQWTPKTDSRTIPGPKEIQEIVVAPILFDRQSLIYLFSLFCSRHLMMRHEFNLLLNHKNAWFSIHWKYIKRCLFGKEDKTNFLWNHQVIIISSFLFSIIKRTIPIPIPCALLDKHSSRLSKNI